MKDKQILEMLKEIITEVDYDIYKEIFYEDGEDAQKTLIDIVKKYIK